eukprot:SAG31_NODE_815_length_11876_cov_2.189182_7_plen_107_part_00
MKQFGKFVDTDLLRDFPEGLPATVARLAILLSVSASYPLFMFIARTSVTQVLFAKLPKDMSVAEYVAVTLGLFGTSFCIAMAVSSLGTILGFVGATVGMLQGFVSV